MTAVVRLSVEPVGVLAVIFHREIDEGQLHGSWRGFIDRSTMAAVVTLVAYLQLTGMRP